MTLDLSPEEFRRLGYQIIDIITEQLAGVDTAPAFTPVPQDLREKLMTLPMPQNSGSIDAILEAFQRDIQAYPMGNNSPRFFGWVNSPAAPLGILAEALAASVNASVAGNDHAPTYVEHGVLGWLKSIVRFPASSGALLTSGGSMASMTALGVMRYVKTQGNLRQDGMVNEAPMVVYASEQAHHCVQKAVEILGFGSRYFRKIPVNAAFQIDVDALERQIKQDREAGLRPVCVAISTGTVNTGAIDPIHAVADVCEREDLWLHIDGAYGAVGILAEQTAGLYDGIERADSIALDPHKWMYVPVECGCVIVKDAQAMRDAYSFIPPYARADDGFAWFMEFGFQQTRGFKALKLWMVFQQIGLEGYKKLITRDIDLARKLQARLEAHPDFEIVGAGPLSVTCFRYAPPDVDSTCLNELNKQVNDFVNAEGRVFLKTTELNGQIVQRACIVNFRTQERDLDILIEALENAGKRVLEAEFSPCDRGVSRL